MLSKDYILSEIRRTAIDGKALGYHRFESETGIKESDWSGKYWAKWGDALTEAGFKPNKMQKAYSDEYLLSCYIVLIRQLNKFPTSRELKLKSKTDSSFPSKTPFERLGLKDERISKIIEYCSNRKGYEDIIKILEPISKAKTIQGDDTSSILNDDWEFVYLFKSGKYYKIGRSKLVEKRAYEIGIKLPEKLVIVHKIRTDDPCGIEKYWHNRFSDKCIRGEWFKLTNKDVQIFKRRKFM